ncbi:iron ABC transporter substrate-binding protein [Aureimonas flava]|uniref:Iron ABC transporter substrate-binding protein n=1 Tax=Aureimonas flava TaxID=2320271 RepID=A0A3A1WHG5_9HYPH|nr:ABC transporter substrate-binding protein [Aureimonas flava]RIX98445.1 iron ABC transporter substrate-binding protein [Aureimonas flava]
MPRPKLHRRALLAGLIAAAGLPRAVPAAAPFPRRIACFDYALAETLLLLGVEPVAVMSAADWPTWTGEPPLPPGVADLGASQEPNLERLAAIRPDLILSTDYTAMVEPAAARIAPVERLSIYGAASDPLPRAREVTLALGDMLGLAHRAADAVAGVDAQMAALRDRLPPNPPPLLMVAFMDTRHARVFGRASLFGNAVEQIGLRNAYPGEVNPWGFATVGVEELAPFADAFLLSIDPAPADTWPTLARSPLWTELPFVREGRVRRLAPVLTFGAMSSAARCARLVTEALAEQAA